MADDSKVILVTGASGYVGSHAVAHLLDNEYQVRAVGRNQETCDKMHILHGSHNSRFQSVIVPDMTIPGAFDQAVQGVNGILHIASPFTYHISDNERDLIVPAVNGTLELLRSALKSPAKHVVVTASFASVADFSKGLRPGHVYDESQWNPMTWAETKNDHRGLAYAGSKKLAEEAAWQFMKDHASDIPFGLTTICPVMIYGPPLNGSVKGRHLGQSMKEIHSLMDGSRNTPLPTPMPVFVDVRDVALAHIRALKIGLDAEKRVQGRYLLSSGSFSMDEVCRLLRDRFPEIRDCVPIPATEEPQHYIVDASRARNELGLVFRGFEECFLDTAKALLELA